MTPDEASNALAWAESALRLKGHNSLSKDERVAWVTTAALYTREEWHKGIMEFVRRRDNDFPPLIGHIEKNYLPCKTIDTRPEPMHGFIEDPDKTYAENWKEYQAFRGYIEKPLYITK